MQKKTEPQMETFNDGICSVYSPKETVPKYAGLHFQERVIGSKRFFEAAQHNIKVDRLIRVPMRIDIDAYDYVTIEGKNYTVEQTQHIKDKMPPVTDLTLRQTKRGKMDGQ